MSQKKVDDKKTDIFVLNSLYPEADTIFSFKPQALEHIKDDCLVVLDTSVLLIPFNTGKESLQQIKLTYERLVQNERLIVPGRAAREFAKNRSEQLKTIYQQISRKQNISITRQAYPLLESSIEYQKLKNMEKEIDSKLSDYRKQVVSLLSEISNWYWNDPVSSLYRELFGRNVVFDIEYDEAKLQSELEYRQLHRIPPGFQDSAKEDKGIGDFLIWYTILELGKIRHKDTVFVTNDAKNDWRYRSEDQALYPRFELVEEYRRNSDGKTIHIINFSDFLKLFGASPEVVDEVRQEEILSSIQKSEIVSPSAFGFKAVSAVEEWIRANYPESKVSGNRHGFPDFIVQNVESKKHGFEVKAYRQSFNISFHIRELIYKAQEAFNREVIDKLTVVFVLGGKSEENIEGLALNLGNLKFSRDRISVVLGTLSSDGKFVQRFYFGRDNK